MITSKRCKVLSTNSPRERALGEAESGLVAKRFSPLRSRVACFRAVLACVVHVRTSSDLAKQARSASDSFYSRCLNVCDYALWSEVNRRMRLAEGKWPAGRTESRDRYLARLRRTALGLPASFVESSVADMRRRCRLLAAFEKGGKGAKSQ